MRRMPRKFQTNSTEAPPVDEGSGAGRGRGVQDHEAVPSVKVIFRRTKRRYGHVTLPARLRARDPKLLALCEQMSLHTAAPGRIGTKLKELVQLKVAAMVGCSF